MHASSRSARSPGEQFVLRVQAPRAARTRNARHVRAHRVRPVDRRCAGRCRSCARAPTEGWLEFLYKPKGHGLEMLGAPPAGRSRQRARADRPRLHGRSARPRLLALGGGVGIPPMIFLAEQVRADRKLRPLVLMGSEVPFPFELVESRSPVPGVGKAATHAVALLEQWGVPSRLASNAGIAGAHRGYITDLARDALQAMTATRACGDSSVRVRPDADAEGRREARARVRLAVPSRARGVHGVRHRRLRRLHGLAANARRPGHEARLRRRPRLRRPPGLPR